MARRSRNEDADELSAHLEFATRKYISRGMPPEQARRLAVLEFGRLAKTLEECRDVNSWRWLESAVRNVRCSLRSLGRSPVFSFVSLLLLTIGIASNVAVFSTIDALFLRPLPSNGRTKLSVSHLSRKETMPDRFPPLMLEGLAENRAFNGICGFSTSYIAAELAGGMRQLGMAAFSGGCIATLGLGLQLGRPITPEDDRPNTLRIAVITDALWREAFGGRPDVLGSTIRVEDETFTIVGVTQKGFTGLLLGFPEPIMIPLRQQPFRTRSDRRMTYWWVTVFARRAAGISDSQALASVVSSQARLFEQSVPARYNAIQRKDFLSRKLTVSSARNGLDYFLRRCFGAALYVVFGLSATILLMTCLNLVSLLLARSSSRRHEVAVRLAIGARRAHIAMLFILENSALLLIGAGLGILAGLWSARTILTSGGRMFGNFDLDIAFDLRVALFLIGTLLLVFGIFTIASVWQVGLASADTLKRTARTFQSGFVQKNLLFAHIALTLALVSNASLFGASIRNMYAIDFGIQPKHVWSIVLAPRPGGYINFNPEPYYRNLLSRIESLTGVVSASIGNGVPFYDAANEATVNAIDTVQPGPDIRARVLGVGDRFFETLGAKIGVGEDFRRTGNGSSEPSVIISKSLASQLGNPNALLGHHLRVGDGAKYQRVRIDGISSNMDLNLSDLENQRPYTVFTSFWQDRELERYPVLLVRMSSNSLDRGAVRHLVEQQSREYVERFATVTEEIDNALIENRLLAYLSGAFSALALAVAAVGLFGLLSYQVSSRTPEIGIRMALGAKPLEVQTLFFRQVAGILLIGSIGGVVLLFGVHRAIASLLFGTSASSLSLFSCSVGVLAATALAASWIPVRRASRIDPSQALHHP